MAPYWLLLFFPVVAILSGQRLNGRSKNLVWIAVWLLISLMVGFRHEVGGDWYNYLARFSVYHAQPVSDVLSRGDPLYHLLAWVVANLGGTIHWVNFFCALVVSAGIVHFVRTLPLPWLGLFVSIPYLIIVVAMGYTRQATALGFLLLGLVSLKNRQIFWFVFWVLIGAGFHKSVVLMLPIAALSATTGRFWTIFWVGCASLIGAYIFVLDSADILWASYVEAGMQSEGGLIRVLMNAVPAAIFLTFGRRFPLTEDDRRLWWWMSVFAIACIPLVMLSSTATDRVALYLIPLQLFVFARLHQITRDATLRAFIVLGVVVYYALVQAVWLFFAAHAFAWLPYQLVWLL